MNNYQKIKELLTKSNLLAEQVDELLVLFQRSGDEELMLIVEVLSKDLVWAEKLYQNYAAKKASVESKDNVKMEEIFKDEAEMLEKTE